MRVTSIQVENYKRIVSVNVKLSEHITEISGENGAGKSSFIDALWVLLKGRRVAAAEPIRKGAQRCRIRGRIGEYLVTRTFQLSRDGSEVTTKLQIERGDESMPPTEQFLKGLIGEHMLDPGDFIALGAAEKFDVFRSFVPGIDFKVLTNQNRKDYDRRTEVNRLAKDSRSAASLIVLPNGVPDALVDEQALIDGLQKAGETNADIATRKANRERAVDRIQQLRAQADAAMADIQPAQASHEAERGQMIQRLEAQIEDLQRQIQGIRDQTQIDLAAIEQTRTMRAEGLRTEADSLQVRLDAAEPLPQPVDADTLRQGIEKARRDNENVRKRLERDKHVKTAETYEAESTQITERMEARERTKQEAIAKADLPVPGITFGDGEVFLDGVPFDQASTAQKLRVAVAIAIRKNPTLRLVWIRDASLLDDRSYGHVEQLAHEFDCQIILETVRPVGKDAIVLENGELAHQEEAPAEEAQEATA